MSGRKNLPMRRRDLEKGIMAEAYTYFRLILVDQPEADLWYHTSDAAERAGKRYAQFGYEVTLEKHEEPGHFGDGMYDYI